MTLGKRIRQARQIAEKTQRQMADATGLAISYLSRVENDRINPSVRTVAAIADALGVEVATLFGGTSRLEPGDRCPVSLSGKCILEAHHAVPGRANDNCETYTAEHLRLLRDCNILLHQGNREVVTTLRTVVRSLLAQVDHGEGGDGRR